MAYFEIGSDRGLTLPEFADEMDTIAKPMETKDAAVWVKREDEEPEQIVATIQKVLGNEFSLFAKGSEVLDPPLRVLMSMRVFVASKDYNEVRAAP